MSLSWYDEQWNTAHVKIFDLNTWRSRRYVKKWHLNQTIESKNVIQNDKTISSDNKIETPNLNAFHTFLNIIWVYYRDCIVVSYILWFINYHFINRYERNVRHSVQQTHQHYMVLQANIYFVKISVLFEAWSNKMVSISQTTFLNAFIPVNWLYSD